MAKYTAQGSISIQRVRNGETIMARVATDGAPLMQELDIATGKVLPDFTTAEKKPRLTPKAYSGSSQRELPLSNVKWWMNNVEVSHPSLKGLFSVGDGGVLTIVGNLASPSNVNNVTLRFTAQAMSGGIAYDVQGYQEFIVVNKSGNVHTGLISVVGGASNVLSSAHTSCTLQADLYSGGQLVPNYDVEFEVNGQPKTGLSGNNKQITISRDDVDYTAMVVAIYKVSGAEVARAMYQVFDLADGYQVIGKVDGDAGHYLSRESQVINCSFALMVRNADRMEEKEGGNWVIEVYRNGVVVDRKEGTNKIAITARHTDASAALKNLQPGEKEGQYNVIVTATVNF